MARGNDAKNEVIKKIQSAFGEDFIGEVDKKIYVWSKENGERMQIAISLTCPKNPIGLVPIGDHNFDDDAVQTYATTSFEPAEITQEERDNILSLMEKLDSYQTIDFFAIENNQTPNPRKRVNP